MKYFYTFSILLFIQFSSAELAPMFLECGKCSRQSCDGISELAGKANTLIKIRDLPKESASGNSNGKILGPGLIGYSWKLVGIKYDALSVYIRYSIPIFKRGTNSEDTLKIARNDLKLLGQECKLITEEELEEQGSDIIKTIMSLNKI